MNYFTQSPEEVRCLDHLQYKRTLLQFSDLGAWKKNNTICHNRVCTIIVPFMSKGMRQTKWFYTRVLQVNTWVLNYEVFNFIIEVFTYEVARINLYSIQVIDTWAHESNVQWSWLPKPPRGAPARWRRRSHSNDSDRYPNSSHKQVSEAKTLRLSRNYSNNNYYHL